MRAKRSRLFVATELTILREAILSFSVIIDVIDVETSSIFTREWPAQLRRAEYDHFLVALSPSNTYDDKSMAMVLVPRYFPFHFLYFRRPLRSL